MEIEEDSSNAHLDRMNAIIEKIRSLSDEVLSLSKSKDKTKINTIRTQIALYFAELKANNRKVFSDLEEWKHKVDAVRRITETHELDLQNLLYQENNLKREIEKSESYNTSVYNTMEILSMDEFKNEAPTSKYNDKMDNHTLELNRLSYEMDQRKRLLESKDELEHKRVKLNEELNESQSFLDSLHTHLNTLEDATKPIQEHFQYTLSKDELNLEMCNDVPSPLYILYSLLNHYITINKYKVDFEFIYNENNVDNNSDEMSLSSSSNNTDTPRTPRTPFTPPPSSTNPEITTTSQENSNKMEETNNNQHTEKQQQSEMDISLQQQQQERKKDVLKLTFSDSSNSFICFYYNQKDQYMEIINGTEYLYTELFSNENKQPFLWLQYLSGLTSTTSDNRNPKYNELKTYYTRLSTNGILKKLLLRLESHRYLENTLLPVISQLKLDISTTKINSSLYFPLQNPKCLFASWSSCKTAFPPSSLHYNSNYFASEYYNYYYAGFNANKFECKVVVGIPLDYPLTPSQIAIISSKDCDYLSPNVIKCIEIEINAFYDEFIQDKENIDYDLLTYQLKRLQMCLDVISANPTNYSRFHFPCLRYDNETQSFQPRL